MCFNIQVRKGEIENYHEKYTMHQITVQMYQNTPPPLLQENIEDMLHDQKHCSVYDVSTLKESPDSFCKP